MQYRKLGRTGLMASEIGLGGEHLEGKDYKTVEEVIGTALDGGVNIIDVFMPQPAVRSNMGRAIGSRRKDVLLQGHIGSTLDDDGQYLRSRDPVRCDAFIKDFLTRFSTDYIDLGMLHFIDTQADYDAAFETSYIDYATGLKEKGVVRFLGASSHDPDTAIKMVKTGLIDVLLFSINPAFDMRPGEDLDALLGNNQVASFTLDEKRAQLYKLCEAQGVAITVMKTLGAGRLLQAQSSSFGVALTIPQCVSYALDRPGVASVLLGAKTAQEMQDALSYEDTTPAQRDYTVLSTAAKQALQGKCMYCNHCLPCPVGMDIASVTKYLDMAKNDLQATVRAHYDALAVHGGDCIGCGSCESNCPFNVAIRENMQAAARLFGR